MSGDHRDRGRPDVDRDGVPLATERPAGLAEVYPLRPPTGDHGPDPAAALTIRELQVLRELQLAHRTQATIYALKQAL